MLAEVADEHPLAGAYAKLSSGTLAPARAVAAMQIGRGAVVAWPREEGEHGDHSGVATRYLGSRAVSISAGSNEMQRNIISI